MDTRRKTSHPREVGLTLWFAAAAFVLAVVGFASGSGAMGAVMLLLTFSWGTTGIYRALRIHRHVTSASRV